MNKAYLLVICLLLAPFTGCIEPEEIEITSDPVEDEDNSQIDETKDESDNNSIDFIMSLILNLDEITFY